MLSVISLYRNHDSCNIINSCHFPSNKITHFFFHAIYLQWTRPTQKNFRTFSVDLILLWNYPTRKWHRSNLIALAKNAHTTTTRPWFEGMWGISLKRKVDWQQTSGRDRATKSRAKLFNNMQLAHRHDSLSAVMENEVELSKNWNDLLFKSENRAYWISVCHSTELNSAINQKRWFACVQIAIIWLNVWPWNELTNGNLRSFAYHLHRCGFGPQIV